MWARKLRLVGFAAVALMLAGGGAFAETAYPTRPVKMVIPFAPGGASDFVARVIQSRLADALGQQIVVENRPGAAGALATELVVHAAPDGYTTLLGNIGTLAINRSVFAHQMKIDPVKELAPVTLVADTPSLLIVRKTLDVNTPKELVAYAKAHPGQLNFASPGSGSLNRLEMELFRKRAGLEMVHVPYKGGAGPAVADVIAGHVDLMFTTTSSAITHVQAGLIKGLAVSSRQRVPGLPNVPTMVESGFPDSVSSSWQGLVVPVGTPKEIVRKLYDALIKTLSAKDIQDRLQSGGMDVITSKSPEEFGKFLVEEDKRWAVVVQESGATAD